MFSEPIALATSATKNSRRQQ